MLRKGQAGQKADTPVSTNGGAGVIRLCLAVSTAWTKERRIVSCRQGLSLAGVSCPLVCRTRYISEDMQNLTRVILGRLVVLVPPVPILVRRQEGRESLSSR